MAFLSSIENRQGLMRGKIEEIRSIVARTPVPTPATAGVTNGLRIPYRLRDRLIEVQSRHRMGSVKEVIFKCLMLGLVTLERLPPMVNGNRVGSPEEFYRVNRLRPLSDEDVSRLRDEGFNAPRTPPVVDDMMPS
jgi:hypothetical protein